MSPLALALDTSTAGFTLALFSGRDLLHFHQDSGDVPQSQRLLQEIQSAFQAGKVTPERIQNVIFCQGPGRFTSLRVGLATLMGLFAPQSQTVGFYQVSSLWMRCRSLPVKNHRVALIRAGHEKCFAGFLRQKNEEEVFEEGLFSFEDLKARLKNLGGDLNVLMEEALLQEQLKDLKDWGHVLSGPVIEPSFFIDFDHDSHFQKTAMTQAKLNYFLGHNG